MSNVAAIVESAQSATFPFTEEQQSEISYEIEAQITDAFANLDVNMEDETTRHFLYWLEGQCIKAIYGDLYDAVESYQATFRSFDHEDPGKERRLRRQLQRDGYILRKSRARNINSPTYGLYWIIDATMNLPAAHGDNADGGMTLFEVEDWINTPAQATN